MSLSKKALENLRNELIEKFGFKDTKEFSDEDINEIGMFLLTSLAEVLKMRANKKQKII
jgi:hypothetical protein